MAQIRPAKHHGFTCDNCGMDPIQGHRYKCINCEDFDLCHNCEEFHLELHDKQHIFLKLRIPRANASFPFIPIPASLGQEGTLNPITGRPRHNLSSSSSHAKAPVPRRGNGPPPSSFVDTVNRFGCKLLNITTDRYSNAVAAMNIYHCLMMVAAGSRGENLTGFAKTLAFPERELQDTMENILQLDRYCKRNSSDCAELSSACSIWHGKSIVLEPGWSNAMRSQFQATIAPQEPKAINDWAARETKGKITKLASESERLSGWEMRLIAALYFKAQWKNPFQRDATRNEEFYSFDQRGNLRVNQCSIMRKTEDMLYQEDEVAQMCVLPYKTKEPQSFDFHSPDTNPQGPEWKAAIILPKATGMNAISAILSHLSSTSALRSLLESKGVRSRYVSLSLPRFTLKSKLDLSEPLSDQGLAPAFETSLNFSPITRSGPTAISKVQHDIFIDVHEEGTEVAATTVVTMFGRAARLDVPVEMKVNRPFVFIVFDDVTKLVLCMAVVSEVNAAE